ncbi:MAG: chemotaxis-specific protein-glutamate methyltransferase CheB [Sedimenticola sp.]
MNEKVTVVIADDSPIVRSVLLKILSSDPGIEVVGVASNGMEALDLVKRLNPSVLCTDLHMPKMDGMELTRRVMQESPLPIIVISVSVVKDKQQNIFELLDAGAVDVFAKPSGGFKPDSEEAKELVEKIKIVAGIRVIRKNHFKHQAETRSKGPGSSPAVIAIGASTGGPQILHTIFSQLPEDFPLPILCVQHISNGFLESLITWLDESTPLHVAIAHQGEIPKPGHIYFPQENHHLVVNNQGRLRNLDAPPVGNHRPAINVMFNSLPGYYGKNILTLLLSGMGEDGVEGLQHIARSGGVTIAQDEATSVVFGMPKAAIALGIVNKVLSMEKIPEALVRYALEHSRRLTGTSA